MQEINRTEIATLGEFGLIKHLTKDIELKNPETQYGVGDDAAVLEFKDKEVLVTTDLLMEGVHFDLVYTPLKHLGYKSAIVNFSDIYAMNGTPKQITVSIALSKRFCIEDLEQFYDGLKLACELHHVDIVGGDTTSSVTGLAISITCIGEADKDKVVYRNGAQDTDLICVSGDLGGAYMGLQLLEREKQLFSGESEYQRIDVFDSEEFGKFIALDGEIVFSEKDEFIYDEMVTHVPMAVHPCVKDVLIIGGGDGGVAKELLQYDCVEHIDVVETDEMFVEVSRKFFPEVACALDDPRVEVHYDDGLRFLRNKKAKYDLIINDSTDPFGHTEGLFTKEFYGSCYSALKEDGIMVYQHGSPFYDEDELACRSMHRKAFRSFPISRVYQAHIPTCPSGYWLFGFASKKYHPIKDFKPREWDALNIETWYYTTHLHMGAFMLPKYVEDLLKEEEK